MTHAQITALGLLLIVTCTTSFYWGWIVSRYRQTPISTQFIEKYITDHFPDVWAAYKQGVNEGYEQGLRDGQHEPT